MIVRRRRGVAGPVRRGVSLIEVLLATAIFLIALSAIMLLFRSAFDSATEASRTNLCSRLARTKMAELEAGVGDATVSGGGNGTFDAYPNYKWEVTSVPVGTSSVSVTYDVTVRVWLDTTLRSTEVSYSQVLVDPTYLNNAAPLSPPTTTETSP